MQIKEQRLSADQIQQVISKSLGYLLTCGDGQVTSVITQVEQGLTRNERKAILLETGDACNLNSRKFDDILCSNAATCATILINGVVMDHQPFFRPGSLIETAHSLGYQGEDLFRELLLSVAKTQDIGKITHFMFFPGVLWTQQEANAILKWSDRHFSEIHHLIFEPGEYIHWLGVNPLTPESSGLVALNRSNGKVFKFI